MKFKDAEDVDLQDHPPLMQGLAGFDLAGWRETNGVIRLGSVGSKLHYIDGWPQSIYLFGNTYELEDVIDGNVDPQTGAIFQNAQYC